ncbi:MAG TPA: hypothetical protein PKD85_23440, partial [Saprospiraceae bacterium]|nr:hypothetical protein [Saprospiraceae bacterium]
LALQMLQESYTYLVKFFEDDNMEAQGKSAAILKYKADSLKTLIDRKIAQVASISDQSAGLVLQAPNAKRVTLEKEIMSLSTAYGEILKSYELSDVGMRDTKAMFLTLDESLPPLEPKESSLLINLIKGILLGGLVGTSLVIGAKIVRDALNA